MATQRTRVFYEFGGYRLDPQRRSLTAIADGRSIPLAPRVFDTLVTFVERPGELIAKDALIAAVWAHSAVEDNSLDQSISLLRRALGEHRGENRFIVTLPGRGYQFVAGVRTVPRDQYSDGLSSNPQSKQLYAQAKGLSMHPTEDNVRGAIELLRQAIGRDSRFSRAWALLAHVYGTAVQYDYPIANAVALAREAATRSLDLNAEDGDAHAALGLVNALCGWWIEAEDHFQAAAALPRDPYVGNLHCTYVTMSAGHLRRALDEALQAHRSSLAQPFAACMVALAHALLGNDDEALQYADKATALGMPKTITPQVDLYAQLAMRAGLHYEAEQLWVGSLAPLERNAGGQPAVGALCSALAAEAPKEEAANGLRAFEARLGSAAYDAAMRKRLTLWYTMLGALDRAYDILDRALERDAQRGTVGSAWGFLWMSEMRPFRADARFQRLLQRLRLPVYWQRHGPPDGYDRMNGALGLRQEP